MLMSVPFAGLVPASLASLCIETLLYGIFIVLFALSLCLMANAIPFIHGERRPYPKPMLFFAILTFFLLTAHWILSVVRAFQAFFLHLNGQAAAEFFADRSQLSSVLREGVLMGVVMTGDLTIVYRLWSVWNHNRRVVIIPMTLFIGLCAFAVITVYKVIVPDATVSQNTMSGKLTFTSKPIWIIALSTTSFGINLYCNGMIGFMLYRASKDTRDWESISWFRFTGIILVESLALYTIWGIFLIAFYHFQSAFYTFFNDIGSPVIGIAFILLHVRVGMRRLGRNAATLVEGRPGRVKRNGEV